MDHVAPQSNSNNCFEEGAEEGLDIIEEFCTDESRSEPQKTHDLKHAQDIQKGLQQSVQVFN